MTLPHGPFNTVHCRIVIPTPRPVTVEVGEFGAVIVPDPLTMLHVPVPGKVTVLPASVTLVVGVQID